MGGGGENWLVSNVRRIQLALAMVLGVIVAGSIGYVVPGFGVLDAVYQTVGAQRFGDGLSLSKPGDRR